MGLVQNINLLEKLQKYLQNTNFSNQILGHNLTLSFLPKGFEKKLLDKRYSFKLKHRLFSGTKEFTKSTYSEIIIGIILELTEDIKNVKPNIIELYEQVGLIENKKCTKELISTIVGNCIALAPASHTGNTTTNIKYSDNLQNIFPEFGVKPINEFLKKLDNYKQPI